MNGLATIGRILLATDFSPAAKSAEAYAGSIAWSWDARLTAMTVLEFPSGMNRDYPINQQYLTERMTEASSQLALYKQRMGHRGIDVLTRIATGIPSEEIISLAQEEESELIVMGTSGRTGLAHVLLGSTAERVIRTAPCPVLAVHTEKAEYVVEPTAVSLKRILVPVDFSDCSLDALEYAALVAKHAKASLELLHVLEPVVYGLDFTLNNTQACERNRKRLEKRLGDLSGALAAAGIPSTIRICGGTPTDSILAESLTAASDLIVMGTHGRRGISHVMSGSVTEAVLRRTHGPVLTVRSPKFHPDHRRIVPLSSIHVDHAGTGRS
ncbi:MAG TPA: universal stress protein [Nitrospira sp.]|nr:universal stress protein [Nitrospira sp.]